MIPRVSLIALLLVVILGGCANVEPPLEGEDKPLLPQIIQITIIPEPTAGPTETPTLLPTTPLPTATRTVEPVTPQPTVEAMALEAADVESFDVTYGQGFPVPVTLMVRGMFHDVCGEIGRVAQAQTANGLVVGIYLARPLDRVCVRREAPFEVEIPLDISGLDVGTHSLSVNGVPGELHLELGMVATENPDLLCPEAEEGQEQARLTYGESGYCFVYPEAYGVLDAEGSVLVTARARSDVPVPLIGEVRINYLGSPGERSLIQIARSDLEQLGLKASEEAWAETYLGQEPAYSVAPVTGGEEPTRHIYAEHGGIVYRVVFAPHLPAGAGEQADLARELFELVSGSFLFYR